VTAYRILNRHDLLTIMRREREARGYTHLEVDERCGLGSGHYGKIELMGKAWGKAGFVFSPTVRWVLELLDLELILAPRGEIHAETVLRDVRLVPVSEVSRLPEGPMSGPSILDEWRERRRQQQAQRSTKKNRPQRELQPVKVGGATC